MTAFRHDAYAARKEEYPVILPARNLGKLTTDEQG